MISLHFHSFSLVNSTGQYKLIEVLSLVLMTQFIKGLSLMGLFLIGPVEKGPYQNTKVWRQWNILPHTFSDLRVYDKRERQLERETSLSMSIRLLLNRRKKRGFPRKRGYLFMLSLSWKRQLNSKSVVTITNIKFIKVEKRGKMNNFYTGEW